MTEEKELLYRIQALGFAKTELEEYLDTHPESAAALAAHEKTARDLNARVAEFESKFYPLTTGGVMGDRWIWAEGTWPWQLDGEEKNHVDL